MKPINLLPERYRPAAASGGGRGSAYVLLGMLGVLLVCVLAVVLTDNETASARAESARLASERAGAEARAQRLGDFERFQLIKQARLASVSELAQARVDWERLLRELARVLPAGVRLNSLQATAGGAGAAGAATPAPAPVAGEPGAGSGPTLTLGGCAPGYRGVAATLVRLRRLHRTDDVKLTSSSRGAQEDDASSNSTSSEDDQQGCSGRGEAEWAATVTLMPEPTPSGDAEDAAGVPPSLGGGS